MTIANHTQPILVIIDCATDFEAELLWAINYSECTNAPLIILNIIHAPDDTPGFYHKKNDCDTPMDGEDKCMVDDFIKQIHERYPALSALQEVHMEFVAAALPPGRIVEYAEKEQVQIIVMGNYGQSGLTNFLSSSLPCRVARLSAIPVVIVKTPVKTSDRRLGLCRFKNKLNRKDLKTGNSNFAKDHSSTSFYGNI